MARKAAVATILRHWPIKLEGANYVDCSIILISSSYPYRSRASEVEVAVGIPFAGGPGCVSSRVDKILCGNDIEMQIIKVSALITRRRLAGKAKLFTDREEGKPKAGTNVVFLC